MMKTMKWETIQSAAQGRGHEKFGLPCQDKTTSISEGGCYVIALADGAGSAALSHEGAQYAVQVASQHMHQNFDRYFNTPDANKVREELYSLLHQELAALAKKQKCNLQDLASTLLLAAIKEGHYILFHIGDGLIAYRKHGRMLPASLPSNGEFANYTTFTTSPQAIKDMRLFKGELRDIDGFVLMSDGSYASLFHKKTKTPSPALSWLMDLCTYLSPEAVERGLQKNMENEIRAATDDDCSIAILTHRHPDFNGIQFLPRHVLMRLTGLPAENPQSRKRLRTYLRILSALRQPEYVGKLIRRVHLKRTHILKKLNFLQECYLVKKCSNGQYVSLARL